MYEIVNLNQALAHRKIYDFAKTLGLHTADSLDVIECSNYILKAISNSSTVTVEEFVEKYYPTEDNVEDHFKFNEIQRDMFNSSLICPLVFGSENLEYKAKDPVFHSMGAVLKIDDNEMYVVHVDLSWIHSYSNQHDHSVEIKSNPYHYKLRWHFNGTPLRNPHQYSQYPELDRMFYTIIRGVFTEILVENMQTIINLDEDSLDNYWDWFRYD